jgi:hypothetical protein
MRNTVFAAVATAAMLCVCRADGIHNAVLGEYVSCSASDSLLENLMNVNCGSYYGNGANPLCPSNASNNVRHDWPDQVVYTVTMAKALIANTTCRNTSTALSTATWLNSEMGNATFYGGFMWNFQIFQVQYYDMPRKPGDRIESASTLGYKCWALAYLAQAWAEIRGSFIAVMSAADLPLDIFVAQYDAAVNMTLPLCNEVLANCFVNASYDPARNGTCPTAVEEFHFGFDYQNLWRDNWVKYPFFP